MTTQHFAHTQPTPSLVWRVLGGATHRFTLRKQDWFLASILTSFGFVIHVDAGGLMSNAAPMEALWRMAPPDVWGWTCIGIGTLRLSALIVNGTFENFKLSPYIRVFCSMVTCFIWSNIVLGVLASGTATTALAVFPHLLAFEMYNLFVTAHEVGEAERLRLNGSG